MTSVAKPKGKVNVQIVQYLFILALAAMWVGLGVSWVRSRTGRRPGNSISTFSNHLSVLARTSPARQGAAPRSSAGIAPGSSLAPVPRRPAPSTTAMTREQVRKRRRDVIFALGVATAVSLLLALAVGGLFVLTTLVGALLLAGYVYLLSRLQRDAVERRTKVTYLPRYDTAEDEAGDGAVLMLQRSAN